MSNPYSPLSIMVFNYIILNLPTYYHSTHPSHTHLISNPFITHPTHPPNQILLDV